MVSHIISHEVYSVRPGAGGASEEQLVAEHRLRPVSAAQVYVCVCDRHCMEINMTAPV